MHIRSLLTCRRWWSAATCRWRNGARYESFWGCPSDGFMISSVFHCRLWWSVVSRDSQLVKEMMENLMSQLAGVAPV